MLVVSDDHHDERRLIDVLDEQGCVVRCAGPKLSVDLETTCDIGVIAVRGTQAWIPGVIRALRESPSVCATLTLLSSGDLDDIKQSLRDGAVDCVVKPLSAEMLIEALVNTLACTHTWRRRVADAQPRARSRDFLLETARRRAFEPVPTQTVDTVADRLADQGQLTTREREVLYWLLQGHRYDDIATMLGVTSRTAKFHAANLLRKLDLDSRHDLTRIVTQRFST